jgi:hypothetical protein
MRAICPPQFAICNLQFAYPFNDPASSPRMK